MNKNNFKLKTQRASRFILGGALNTGVTYGVYLALNIVINYHWAYLIAYIVGIVFAYMFNSIIVFQVPLLWKKFFTFPMVYIIQYSFSAVILGTLIEFGGMNETLAPLAVTAAMIPLTYIITKWILLPPNLKLVTDKPMQDEGS